MKKYLIFLGLLLFVVNVNSQKLDTELLDGLRVRNVGPAGMSGRITAIDVNPRDKDHIYVGSASGGVWESKNGGITWEPIFDDTGVLSIGSLKINPSNPDEIWVGTGEGNPRNSHNSGAGIFYSNDAGKTWTFKGLAKTKIIHRILIDPADSKTIYAGALGSAWGATEDRGVYKTTDGGSTWTKSLYINKETGVADMVMDPSNPKKIIAAMWEFGRKPWTFNSGGNGSGMHITYDGGETWNRISSEDGMPEGELGRIGIAFAANKPNIIYALVEATVNGLYKSSDGGKKWSLVSEENIGNRPFYYAELYVDPQNENRLYNIYTYVSKSEDGGRTFEEIANYGNAVHPDHHAFWIDPQNPDYIIDGNDGGLNISRDGGENWRFVTNIPVGQFYHVNYDNDFPYHIYGGMQDNGTWRGPHTVYRRGGISNYDWQELYFGDGFDVVPDTKDSRYGYAMSQGGSVGRYDRVTGRVQTVKPVHPEGKRLRYNWNAAIAQDPFDDCGVYFGSQYVHYSNDCGLSYKIISPDLTTNDTTKHKQDESGGLTIDATNAENYTTLLAIAPSPVDKNVIWVSSDDGRLHISKDHGETWTDVASRIAGMPSGAWLPQIEVSATNAGEAYIVANDYRRNNWSAYAFYTRDYGLTWTQVINDNKIPSFICSIIQDDEEPSLLFAGADNGLYVSIDAGTNWSKWNDEMPPVQIRDMKIHPTENDLILGTFGRSFWVVDDIRPLRELARDKRILDSKFRLLDSPDAYHTYTRSYQGIRFSGQSEFRAPNKSTAARINYFMKEEKKDDKKSDPSEVISKKKRKKGKRGDRKPKEDESTKKPEKKGKKHDKKLRYYVINMEGDTIRRGSTKPEMGFSSFSWRKDMKGVDWPRKRDRKRDKDYEPGGPDAPVGKYKIVAIYKGEKDSIEINLKPDPRIVYDVEKEAILLAKYREFSEVIEVATQGMEKLKAAKKTINAIDELTYALPDTTAEKVQDLNREMLSEIESMMDLYTMPSGLKGIQRDPNKLNNLLGTASWYLGSRWGDMGENTENILTTATKAVRETVDQVDAFFEGDLQDYRTEIEGLDFQLFEKIDSVLEEK